MEEEVRRWRGWFRGEDNRDEKWRVYNEMNR